MQPKSGVRYRYYVSLPHLHGESSTATLGSVSRVPAAAIEDVVIKSVRDCQVVQQQVPTAAPTQAAGRRPILTQVARIDVHRDHLMIGSNRRYRPTNRHGRALLSIPWQKSPSRRPRQILIPHGTPRSDVRPTRIERRARLVSAIARGRRWLREIVSGAVTDVQHIATRQKCSVRQVNMTISLAFLAPDLVRAAVEGRLPRGIGVERLRDAPARWSQQFVALGLNPQ